MTRVLNEMFWLQSLIYFVSQALVHTDPFTRGIALNTYALSKTTLFVTGNLNPEQELS